MGTPVWLVCIGIALAVSFYGTRLQKAYHAVVGVILAILLHSTFNFLILNTPQRELLRTFTFVWVGIIALLAALEYVKRLRPRYR